MSQLPENRKPLLWKDMPFADRPKAHPSTERLEIEKLQERMAELEARIAKADALAGQVQRVKDFRYDPNIGIELNRLEESLAAYREGKDT